MKILIIEKQGTDSHYTTVLDDRFGDIVHRTFVLLDM